MSRLTKRILLTALLGLFLTVPGIVRSQGFDAKTLMRAQQRGQTGSLYGNNPFEQPAEEGEEGEQQPQDTTKKERKIRKPLEFFQRFGPLAEQLPLERQARLQPR